MPHGSDAKDAVFLHAAPYVLVAAIFSEILVHLFQITLCICSILYVVESKSFQPDIQKPRQMENAVRDI